MTEQLKMANSLLRKSEAAKIERIEQLESSLDEMAEKWAIAQVNYEDCAKRNTLLESLIRDMWREMITCPDYATSPCMTRSICERIHNLEFKEARVGKYIYATDEHEGYWLTGEENS